MGKYGNITTALGEDETVPPWRSGWQGRQTDAQDVRQVLEVREEERVAHPGADNGHQPADVPAPPSDNYQPFGARSRLSLHVQGEAGVLPRGRPCDLPAYVPAEAATPSVDPRRVCRLLVHANKIEGLFQGPHIA